MSESVVHSNAENSVQPNAGSQTAWNQATVHFANYDLFRATDPVLAAALDLLDRLDHGNPMHAESERRRLLGLFRRGAAICGADRNWQLASYALASWIDEMLVEHPWDGAGWWSNNILEVELFNSRECGRKFFELANEALQLPDRRILSVFRDCVVLGFRGMYSTPEMSRVLASELGVPGELSEWLSFVNTASEQKRVENPEFPTQIEIGGAPPVAFRTPIVWWSLASLLALAANIVVFLS